MVDVNVTNGFPHPHIDAHPGAPNYATITEICSKLNANAASVHSDDGNGLLGHLALTIGTNEYNELSNMEWTTPANPGIRGIINNAMTPQEIRRMEHEHANSKAKWTTYNATNKAL